MRSFLRTHERKLHETVVLTRLKAHRAHWEMTDTGGGCTSFYLDMRGEHALQIEITDGYSAAPIHVGDECLVGISSENISQLVCFKCRNIDAALALIDSIVGGFTG